MAIGHPLLRPPFVMTALALSSSQLLSVHMRVQGHVHWFMFQRSMHTCLLAMLAKNACATLFNLGDPLAAPVFTPIPSTLLGRMCLASTL